MRIIGGVLRGRRLRVPAGVRPTGGRAREALFDIWSSKLGGSRVLDLFAGSGAIGLEALSRGAAACLAVEGGGAVLRVLKTNYEQLLPDGRWDVARAHLPQDLVRKPLRARGPFDLVFADPPYDFEPWAELLAGIAPLLNAGGEAAVEHGRRNKPPEGLEGLELVSRRAYGETELSFYGPSSERPR